jgi:branched-chain amino acid transport system ATP-binding protein
MAAMSPASGAGQALLATTGITRDFGGLRAVDHVDFDLPEGQIRALIGPNGAGKTTFVNLLCGRLSPTAGRIAFAGEDVTRLPAHRRIARGMAYTFQITSIFGALSLYDNVALAAQRLAGGEGLDAAVTAALDQVGLAERTDQTAGDLSYGHQRLLEIAMGLAQRPRLLILDEPTQGLADAEIEGFVTLIREVAQDATILLIEHNMDVVMTLAEHITVMDFGAILAEGTPDEIKANGAVQTAYLGG